MAHTFPVTTRRKVFHSMMHALDGWAHCVISDWLLRQCMHLMDEHTVSSAICSCLVLLSYHISGRVSKCLAFNFIPIFSYLDFSHRQTDLQGHCQKCSGAPTYSFGDEIVLHSRNLSRVSDTHALVSDTKSSRSLQ